MKKACFKCVRISMAFLTQDQELEDNPKII